MIVKDSLSKFDCYWIVTDSLSNLSGKILLLYLLWLFFNFPTSYPVLETAIVGPTSFARPSWNYLSIPPNFNLSNVW